MKIVDANVMIYAINLRADQHEQANGWLAQSLAGGAPLGFAWNALVAFLRITTSHRMLASPLSVDEAVNYVTVWLDQPAAHIVHPTSRHLSVLSGLLTSVGMGGNLVNDAHIAALAIEHRAPVVTYDRDFGRFPGVRWELPSAP